MPEPVRAFVAVQLPEAVRDLVVRTTGCLEPSLGSVFRWTPRQSLHVTLYFLGETDPTIVDQIRRDLETVQTRPIQLLTERLTVFPSPRQPRVLVLTLLDSGQGLAQLQGAIHRVCYPVATNKESKPFKAHVTVGRLRHGSTVDPVQLRSSLEACHPPQDTFTIEEFELVRSFLEPRGPRYETLQVFPVHDP